MTPRFVEQVFLTRKGGGVEVLMVLEDDAGARTRERLPLSLTDLETATRTVARQLVHRGVAAARSPRLRVGSGVELHDDRRLLEVFLAELRVGENREC